MHCDDGGFNDSETFGGTKTAKATENKNEYEITLSVPGETVEAMYNEVVIMVDGSYSQDDNFDKLRETIADLADRLLVNGGNIRVTLMGFGISPKIVASITDRDEIENMVSSIQVGGLYYGKSGTNCEEALKFVDRYISSKTDINDAVVLFVSDGMENMSLNPYYMDFISMTTSKANSYIPYAAYIAVVTQRKIALKTGFLLPTTREFPGFEELCTAFDNAYAADSSSEETILAINALTDAVLEADDEGRAWLQALWDDIFGGSFSSELHTCVDFEHALFEYINYIDSTYGTNYLTEWIYNGSIVGFYDAFYVLLSLKNDYKVVKDVHDGVVGFNQLDSNEKVSSIWLVAFKDSGNNIGSWIRSTGGRITSDKAVFLESDDFVNAMDNLVAEVESTIIETSYGNPVVVDPMSIYVDFQPQSLGVYLNESLIWSYVDGWADGSDNPSPVQLDQEDGKYKITWTVTNEKLRITDHYSLKYNVTIKDEYADEEGDYPLNGITTVSYDGQQPIEIEVPIIKFKPSQPDTYVEGVTPFVITSISSLVAMMYCAKKKED